jgi:hypothetical protein
MPQESTTSSEMCPQPRCPRPLAGGWALLLLLAAPLSLISGEVAAAPGPLTAAWATPADDGGDEDDEEEDGDYPDDGSTQVISANPGLPPAGLTPISPAEEKGLLGNWGDAAGEGED